MYTNDDHQHDKTSAAVPLLQIVIAYQVIGVQDTYDGGAPF